MKKNTELKEGKGEVQGAGRVKMIQILYKKLLKRINHNVYLKSIAFCKNLPKL